MAITRRQFVTRLGALAAAAGLGQADVARLTEAFAYGTMPWNTDSGKPRVVWVHGAECTGCSTSVLGLFEDATGIAVEGTSITTLAAVDLAVGGDGDGGDVPRTFENAGLNVDGEAAVINIQDVLVDVIELDYHETVMSMGGDLAAQWLADFMDNVDGTNKPFVLVVEGAIADHHQGGAWADDASNGVVPWCSIGILDDGSREHAIDDVVATLATKAECAAVVAIGQCATFGGYPACVPPIEPGDAGFASMAQSGAKGTYDFLYDNPATRAAAAKVVNVPGCPTNPWWFVLTVVALLVEFEKGVAAGVDGPLGILTSAGAIKASAVDSTRRLKIVYPTAIHGPYCPRFNDWSIGLFAEKPGDPGCLQKIGCKGPAVKSLCGMHGWNAQQPHNNETWEFGLAAANPAANGNRGGHCTRAGHPCMGCTEKGYPDSFVPFVSW